MKKNEKELLNNSKNKSSNNNETQLNKPITYKFVIMFTIPTILSFLLMNAFGMIDGVFAARGIGDEALGAINFVTPAFMFAIAISTMLSMGGCALIAKK